MNQSTKIVGFLIAAFFVFITVRGELPTYLGFLVGTPANSNTGAATQSPTASTSTPSAANVASALAPAAGIGASITTLLGAA